MTILLEGPCKNKTNKTSDLTTLGQNLNLLLSCIDLDRIMAEMSISWEQLSNQAPLVPFTISKSQLVISNHREKWVMASGLLLRTIFRVFVGAPSLFQRAQWLLNQILCACGSFPVCPAAYLTSPLPGAVLSHCDLGSCRWQYGFLLIY